MIINLYQLVKAIELEAELGKTLHVDHPSKKARSAIGIVQLDLIYTYYLKRSGVYP